MRLRRLCTIQCAEADVVCGFCRARDRFWRTLDNLPVRRRGWGIQNLRIWTSIVKEELEVLRVHLCRCLSGTPRCRQPLPRRQHLPESGRGSPMDEQLGRGGRSHEAATRCRSPERGGRRRGRSRSWKRKGQEYREEEEKEKKRKKRSGERGQSRGRSREKISLRGGAKKKI